MAEQTGTRRVHAITRNGNEIVRYDLSSKWFIEGEGREPVRINLEEAAQIAVENNPILGVKGGRRFDHMVIKLLREKT